MQLTNIIPKPKLTIKPSTKLLDKKKQQFYRLRFKNFASSSK